MQIPAPRPPDHPQLDDWSDSDLLVLAGMRGEDLSEEDEREIREAFAVLYHRHAEALLRLLRRSQEGRFYQELEGKHALAEAVDETFLRACDRSETYNSEKAGVRTWMVQIARNLVISRLREERDKVDGRQAKDVDEVDLKREAAMELYQDKPAEINPELINVIRDALTEAITEKEWELLTRYLAIQAKGETGDRAPRGAAQKLACMLNTTPQNLRTTKSRALGKIRDYVRERMPDRVPE